MSSIVLWALLVTMSQVQIPQVLWEHRVDFAGRTDTVRRVIHAGDFVIVSGIAQSGTITELVHEWAVRVYNKETGTLVWAAQAAGPRIFGTFGVFAVNQNRLYLAAELNGNVPFTRDVAIRAYDIPTGQVIWERIINTGRTDTVTAIDASRDLIAVVGHGGDSVQGNRLRGIVRVFDEDGDVVLEDSTIERLNDVSISGPFVTVGGNRIQESFADLTPPDWFIRTYRVRRDD